MSDLIEKVAREIRVATLKTVMPEITDAEIDEIFRTRLVDYDPEARAAIAAVAEWLDGIGKHTAAAELRAGSIMEAAHVHIKVPYNSPLNVSGLEGRLDGSDVVYTPAQPAEFYHDPDTGTIHGNPKEYLQKLVDELNDKPVTVLDPDEHLSET